MIGDNVLERQLHALLYSGEVTDSDNYEAVVAAAKSFEFGALSRLTRREYRAFLRRRPTTDRPTDTPPGDTREVPDGNEEWL